MPSLDQVSALAAARAKWDEKLRAAIIQAHAEGASIRKLAEAAGLSHGTIHRIVRSLPDRN